MQLRPSTLRALRLALALAVLASIAQLPSAHADTHIVSSNAKNDGQRWNIGKQETFCGQWKASAGFTMMANVNMADTTVTPIMMNFSSGAQGGTGSADQFQWWMLNATWTTDYANAANHVIVQFSDVNDTGYFFGHKAITLTVGTYAHHALTCNFSGTGSPPSPANTCTWYVNGVANGTAWTETFGQALIGSIASCANDMYIAAHLKNGGTIVDYSDFDGADFRTYSRALSADEINQIYKLKGRDLIRRGLRSRYTFWTDGKNTGPLATNTKWYFTDATQSTGYTENSTDTANKTETNAGNLKKMTVALGASVATPSVTNTTTSAEKWFFRAFASPSLASQSVASGTVTFRAAPVESNAGLNHFMKWYCYVLRAGSNVATIAGPADEATESATSTTSAGREHAVSFSAFDLQDGDQIVVEMWSGGTAGATTGYTHQPQYGGTTDITEGTTNASPASNVEFTTPIFVLNTAATAEKSAGAASLPTITTTKVLSGTHRKVMRIDLQRVFEPAKNEDIELAEPRGKVAA